VFENPSGCDDAVTRLRPWGTDSSNLRARRPMGIVRPKTRRTPGRRDTALRTPIHSPNIGTGPFGRLPPSLRGAPIPQNRGDG